MLSSTLIPHPPKPYHLRALQAAPYGGALGETQPRGQELQSWIKKNKLKWYCLQGST